MSQYQWLRFHLYDLKAGTVEETVWKEWDSIEALVQEWKDKGYRLVLEGYVTHQPGHHPMMHPWFVPAGDMARIWAAYEDHESDLHFGTRIFIWETGDRQNDDGHVGTTSEAP